MQSRTGPRRLPLRDPGGVAATEPHLQQVAELFDGQPRDGCADRFGSPADDLDPVVAQFLPDRGFRYAACA